MYIPEKMPRLLILSLLLGGCAVKTPPLTHQDLVNRIKEDTINMFRDQEPLNAPLALEEALARGLKYNLDHRVKLMEDAISLKQVELMSFDMLPRVVAAAGYSDRDSYNASSSTNIYTWQQSLAPSTSQDRGHYTGDLTMTWNILDFGVSYLQASQQAERAHIMAERRRKVVHTIFQQIRQGYWQALGAQELEERFSPLLKEVNEALKDMDVIEKEKLRPQLEILAYKKTLLEILKQLEGFRDELAQAKPRLAALINLPVGQKYTLSNPGNLALPEIRESLELMEQRALFMRPELRESDYNERVSVHEVKKTILRMLPSAEMTVGGHFDSNSFLIHKKWVEGGARLTWNLLNLLSGPTQYKIVKNQTELVKAQRMALSMAILTQVHVAYQDFNGKKRQYELSEQLLSIDSRIHEQTSKQARTGSENRLNEIKAATASLMADYRRYQNYAALQNAYGQISATLGHDPLPETISGHDLKTLITEISKRLDPTPEEPQKKTIQQESKPTLISPAIQPDTAETSKVEPSPKTIDNSTASVNTQPQSKLETLQLKNEEEDKSRDQLPETVTEMTESIPLPETESDSEKTVDSGEPSSQIPIHRKQAESQKLEKLLAKANSGNSEAQRRLGWLYSSGTWVQADKTEAINWYRKAASLGDLEAQLALGWIYYTGSGVTVDISVAAQWYRKAAAQGSRKADFMLRKIDSVKVAGGA